MANIYDDILKQIKTCEENFFKIGLAAQVYIDAHDVYLERNLRDSSIIKKKMKEKIVRVINED
jgi:SMC interacting uncharacterized protein involved in chromosome segregation